ncbi:MAG TPA: AAA family ATPase [Herpetosiphonaceae bacterium]|nr:AAA family ATPase [Herpetosiphonaceae bacterium]
MPELEFDGIHIACLSGENGAGKSALLDAITWALWGKARVASDDELIALGEQEMEVDLQFGVAGSSYRVLRRRSSAKRGQTFLDVQAATASGWRSLSGNSVRETQNIITDVLRMEYDTFINSAFLVQGKADEFTRKAPAERKRVLAEVLGLDAYERLEERAKAQVRDLDEHIHGLEALMASLREPVARRDWLIQEEAETRARVESIGLQVEAASLQVEQTSERRRALEARKAERDREQIRLNDINRHLTESRAEQAAISHEIMSARAIVERQDAISQGERELAAARTELIRMDSLKEQALAIRDEKRAVEDRISVERQLLQRQLDRINDEISRSEALIAGRATLLDERASLADQLESFASAAETLAAARLERDELEEIGRVLASLQVEVQRLNGAIAVHKDSLIAAREAENRRMAEYDTQLNNEARWREEYATVTTQQRSLSRDERRLSELRVQDQSESQRLGELQARSQVLKEQGEQVNEKLALLQHSGDTTCPLCQSEIGHSGIAEIEQSYLAERQRMRDEYREASIEAKALQVEIDSRRREMTGLERKIADLPTLAGKVARLENALREVEETRGRRAEAQATFHNLDMRLENDDYAHNERASLANAERELAGLGIDQPTLDSRRRAVGQRITQLEQTLGARGSIEARAAVIGQKLDAIAEAEQTLAATRDQMLSLQVRLDGNDFAHADHEEIGRLNTAMQNLGYGTNAHNQIREQVQVLLHWEEEGHQLRAARDQLAGNERQLTRLNELIARNEADAAALQASLAGLQSEVAQLPTIMLEAETAQRTLNESRGRLAVAQKELGAVQQNLHNVEEYALQLKAKESEYSKRISEREIYAELVKAFGKKGIQAMLIETAIPELEREANELLGRMTDNQMHMRFETQRETKKGDTSETLEIHIADEQGTRRYDLYSGGEAFRINFAIRIALSKMLARRAGANLQTLIIDEGFGSQDGRGRERLVEAINHIQSDFNRILVITHLQELKDQFPVHIEITKTELGSRWMVN